MIPLLGASLVWALSFGLTKHFLGGVDPSTIAWARSVLAVLLFAPFLRLGGLPRRAGLQLLGIGALQFGVMYALYFRAFATLKASEVAVMTVFTPILVTLLAAALEKRLSPRAFVPAILATAGALVCIWTSLEREGLWAGLLWIQAANVCFALGQLLYRRLGPTLGRPDHRVVGLMYAGAALATGLLASPALLAGGGGLPALEAPGWGALLYNGLVATGVGFALWAAGTRTASLGTLAAMNNAKVPLAIAASALVFGEAVAWGPLALGGGLLALALLLDASPTLLARREYIHPRAEKSY